MKIFNLKNLVAFSFIILASASFSDEKVYEGKGQSPGFNEDGIPVVLNVKATKKDGKIFIKDITATHEETDKIGGLAIPKMIATVKETQNYTKVDTVAGATATSAAFRRSLRMAIKDIENQN